MVCENVTNLNNWNNQNSGPPPPFSESVNASLANATLVPSSKNWKKDSRWAQRREITQKKPWTCSITLPPCGNRCRFSESSASCSIRFAGAPTIDNRIEQTISKTKVASAKVAFDTLCKFHFMQMLQQSDWARTFGASNLQRTFHHDKGQKAAICLHWLSRIFHRLSFFPLGESLSVLKMRRE